ncbi:unnamed protein product [Nippostrongylus brasiliensis]|uniref:HTH_48 domain-containing protein n=1 Tax=Nippostrongylus brasiliensis TaxID=27835 RepID=A0A0N4YL75_NIPBR|nr:unnamed protein product [Nippostrongylus brasiliensis]
MGDSTGLHNTAKVWFLKFNSGQYDLDDQSQSGRPVAVIEERLLELMRRSPGEAPASSQSNSTATMAEHF